MFDPFVDLFVILNGFPSCPGDMLPSYCQLLQVLVQLRHLQQQEVVEWEGPTAQNASQSSAPGLLLERPICLSCLTLKFIQSINQSCNSIPI